MHTHADIQNKFISYFQSILNLSQDHRAYTFLSTTGQVRIRINSQQWDVDTMDCGGSHNFSITSTSEYFIVYFFYPNLSNLEFHCITDFFLSWYFHGIVRKYIYIWSLGFCFLKWYYHQACQVPGVDEINYKIPETAGYFFTRLCPFYSQFDAILSLSTKYPVFARYSSKT